jgi:hypothetical protein
MAAVSPDREARSKRRTAAQDQNALADGFFVALAHEALDVSAEEPHVPAELDPPQDARASSAGRWKLGPRRAPRPLQLS